MKITTLQQVFETLNKTKYKAPALQADGYTYQQCFIYIMDNDTVSMDWWLNYFATECEDGAPEFARYYKEAKRLLELFRETTGILSPWTRSHYVDKTSGNMVVQHTQRHPSYKGEYLYYGGTACGIGYGLWYCHEPVRDSVGYPLGHYESLEALNADVASGACDEKIKERLIREGRIDDDE